MLQIIFIAYHVLVYENSLLFSHVIHILVRSFVKFLKNEVKTMRFLCLFLFWRQLGRLINFYIAIFNIGFIDNDFKKLFPVTVIFSHLFSNLNQLEHT